MPLSGKQEYTQADGALTEAVQVITFSTDGTNTFTPNGIIVRNKEVAGSTKVVKVYINSDDTVVATLSAGQKLNYSIHKVKQLKLARSATGAPDYSVQGVR